MLAAEAVALPDVARAAALTANPVRFSNSDLTDAGAALGTNNIQAITQSLENISGMKGERLESENVRKDMSG